MINLQSNNKSKSNIILSIIFLSAIVATFFLYQYIEEQKLIKKSSEKNIEISKSENKEYIKNNDNENMKIYTKFKGKIIEYAKYENNIYLSIVTDNYKIENIKTTENTFQNIQYKMNTNNNFEFTCQSKRGNTLENCTIY